MVLITKNLTPKCIVILEKSVATEIVKKFRTFYVIGQFVLVITTVPVPILI